MSEDQIQMTCVNGPLDGHTFPVSKGCRTIRFPVLPPGVRMSNLFDEPPMLGCDEYRRTDRTDAEGRVVFVYEGSGG